MIEQYTLDTYKDLIDEIDILSIRVSGLKREKEVMLKKMKRGPGDITGLACDGMPKGNSENKDMIRWIEDIQRIDNLIYLDSELLDIKEDTLKKLEAKINNFKGIDYKVAFLSAKGNNLKEIADVLGYSYDHIRRVHSNIKKATFMPQTNSI